MAQDEKIPFQPEVDTLRRLIARKGLNANKAAVFIPCSGMEVRNWLAGRRKPTRGFAILLRAAIKKIKALPDKPNWQEVERTLSLYRTMKAHLTLEEKEALLESGDITEYGERLRTLARKIQKRCAQGTPAEAAANELLKE
ncbi:MAG: hypothetical protein A2V67_12590 [Deltaproteobacteria bacterium RBG_13_61_14]|nr:MAG: hypothetical protein A2V67_12590 [Deltaproteobacteria bacterium RBG_13_61_14]